MKNIAIGLLASIFLVACQGSKPDKKVKDHAVPIETITVESVSINNEIIISGSIEGTRTVKVGFMVPGKINNITARVGQPINKGSLIATLDQTDYSLNKKLAEVQKHEAEDEYNRSKILFNKGSLSESDFAKIGFAYKKTVLQEKIQEKSLNDSKIFSPISGIVLDRATEIGEIISAGSPLFTIADLSTVNVFSRIPENDIRGIHIGQHVNVQVEAIQKAFTGNIIEIGALADAASRSFLLKIAVKNPGLAIRPGMIAQINIPSTVNREIVMVPVECIIHDQGNSNFVYVVDKKANKSFKRTVALGKIVDNQVEIISGLNSGDLLVTAGHNKLSDGTAIIVKQ
ncbi:efflux RND transporter periplasmic adaptor subunit [Sphingobacterium sp. DR205]|uniref:efflux RND transporter periplasmic adaptor subunit n=1 Tax=Sphingobacterium sp. DR205 TaxID=2713573 RepID=UPI0013E439AE|nr:efflux RND transporter periplasmic adaptor subunit [Sphingobacterium sp. DR205]QIH35932.1 efflux RND transporter periplasmic adaptor subunit [Sphingobacterium sp. DR205]